MRACLPSDHQVVREIPLPSRFRAQEFEMALEEICERERLKKRDCLLVLIAYRYRLKHCGTAFNHYRDTCRHEVEGEMNAGVVEVQRMWRGSRGRKAAMNQRETRTHWKIQADLDKVRAVIAIWGQARYRGEAGRRRMPELRKVAYEKWELRRRCEAASTIQAGWRSRPRGWVPAAVALLEKAEQYINMEPSTDTSTGGGSSVTTVQEPEGNTAQMIVRSVRDPPRPVMLAEVQAAQVLGTSDEISLSVVSGPSMSEHNLLDNRDQHPTGKGSGVAAKRHRPLSSLRGAHRAPYSNRGTDLADDGNICRERRRPRGGRVDKVRSSGGDHYYEGGTRGNSDMTWDEENARLKGTAGNATHLSGEGRALEGIAGPPP